MSTVSALLINCEMPCIPKCTNKTRRTCWRLLAIALCFLAGQALAEEPLDCLIEPHLLVDVSSSEIGVLATVNVNEADTVGKGDVIAALRTDVERAVLELSMARAGAASEIELLRSDYEFNARKSDRVAKLHNQRVVSAQNADEVRTAQDVARLRLKAAAEKQRNVRLEAERDALALARRIVHSPINGVVLKRHKSAGEYVEGDPIVQLAQLDPLRIEVVAPIALYGQIKKGMQATVTPELAVEGPFIATVVSVDPVMDAATATFGIRLSLPNPQRRLPAGLKCTLIIAPQATKPAASDEPDASPKQDSQPTEKQPPKKLVDKHVAALDKIAAQLGKQPEKVPAEPLKNNTAALPKPALVQSTTHPPRRVIGQSERPTIVSSATGTDLEFPAHAGCVTLGPIEKLAQAKALQALLSKRNVITTIRHVDKQSPMQMWAVLSGERPGTTAELARRLHKAGISDFQVLRRGPWKGRISYGLYRGPKHALSRARTMNDLGFEAERIQRQKVSKQFWLDMNENINESTRTAMQEVLAARHPTINLETSSCPQVASR